MGNINLAFKDNEEFVEEVEHLTSSQYYHKAVDYMMVLISDKYHTKYWSHKFTSIVIKDIADSLEIADEYKMFDNTLYDNIFISDLYQYLPIEDLDFALLYTYEMDELREVTTDASMTVEEFNKTVDGIKFKLRELLDDVIGNFILGDQIKDLIIRANNRYRLEPTSEYHVRIMLSNGITNIGKICDYSYMFCEEYLDYCVDMLIEKIDKIIGDDDARQHYLTNVYKIVNNYLSKKKLSDKFIDKHKENLSMVSFAIMNQYSKFDKAIKGKLE